MKHVKILIFVVLISFLIFDNSITSGYSYTMYTYTFNNSLVQYKVISLDKNHVNNSLSNGLGFYVFDASNNNFTMVVNGNESTPIHEKPGDYIKDGYYLQFHFKVNETDQTSIPVVENYNKSLEQNIQGYIFKNITSFVSSEFSYHVLLHDWNNKINSDFSSKLDDPYKILIIIYSTNLESSITFGLLPYDHFQNDNTQATSSNKTLPFMLFNEIWIILPLILVFYNLKFKNLSKKSKKI